MNLSQLSGTLSQDADSNPISQDNIKNIGNDDWGHTVNVWGGLLFLNSATTGCRIFDLSNPMSPSLLTTYTGGDCHDSCAQRIGQSDILFSADGYTGKYRLINITNVRTSPQLAIIGETSYDAGVYAHSSVVTDDGKTLFVFEESNKFDIAAYDISVISTPKLISKFQWSGDFSEGNITVHNGAIQGNNLIVAYYTAGLRIFDITDVYKIKEIGKYETYRDPDGNGNFGNDIKDDSVGSWNVAQLPSGKILISDTNYGTFVVKINATYTTEPTAEPSENPTVEPTKNPTAEPTENLTAEPTVEPSSEPTTPSTKSPVSLNFCKTYNSKKCLQKGCYWLNNKCRSCAKIGKYTTCVKRNCTWSSKRCTPPTTFSEKPTTSPTKSPVEQDLCGTKYKNRCLQKGCYWLNEECKSCATITKYTTCIKRSCSWNFIDRCTSCHAVSNKETCVSSKCAWKKKKCISCAVIMKQNECDRRGCKWNIDAECAALFNPTRT